MANITLCDDASFGPAIQGCRGDFDFTLLFEQTILSILPSSLLVVLGVARLRTLLSHRKREVLGTKFQRFKLVGIVCYGIVQTALLALWAQSSSHQTRVSLASAVLSLVAVFPLAALSWAEHAYSPRPSALLNVYLLLSVLFDAAQTRTLWLKGSDSTIAALFTTSLALKICLLIQESVEKGRFLPPAWDRKSPEEKSGIYAQSILLWLRRILAKGHRHIMKPDDLYPLESGLATSKLSQLFRAAWASGAGRSLVNRTVLALLQTLKWSFLGPVIPRIVQIACTICQPLLLREFLNYIQGFGSPMISTGYGFIGAYGLVYLCLAISTCWYWRLTYKGLVRMRGCLVAAIYEKTVNIDVARYDMTAPVALMSTDMERLIQGFKDVHEIWANTVQVAISIWLLYGELGIACVAPAVVTVLSSCGSFLISKYAEKSQVKWMEATQERVSKIGKCIGDMKGVKLLGLSTGIHAMLRSLRSKELGAARHFRYIEVLTAIIAFVPLLLSPVFTFMVFLLQSRSSGTSLNSTSIFTSLSLLQLMSQPLANLFQSIPQFIASLGCLGRIGSYLAARDNHNTRMITAGGIHGDTVSSDDVAAYKKEAQGENHNAITIRNGNFGWIDAKPILREIDLDVPKNRLTVVVGPVACGKTTLSKAVVGELPWSEGQVHLEIESQNIAYCDQEPFLMNGSLRDNILGFSHFDNNWYEHVCQAVDLSKDISSFPGGDLTQVGSRGVALSGGQRQRLTIARAVYARASLAVFDDVLSGLDATTKDHVFQHVFGPQGLLRKMNCTVLLFTHDISALPQADHIIVLSKDGRIAESGTYEKMAQSSEYIKSLAIRDNNNDLDKTTTDTVGVPKELTFPGDVPDLDMSNDLKRRLGDPTIYKYMFGHIGLWRMLVFAAYQCGWAVFSTIGPVWLNFWASAIASGEDRNTYYMVVYSVFQTLGLVFLALFAGHTLISIAVKSGSALHEVALNTLMRAPLSFFSTVDMGVTLNRFSQDIILIDGELPLALLDTVSAGLVALVQLVIIAVAAPYVAIAYPFLLLLLFAIQGFYLRTSRQLRFLELEAKAPLYTHFLETLHGITTIRSFGWASESLALNQKLIDASQRPLYLLYMVQRWLQLVLELMIAVTAVVLIAVAVRLSSSTTFLGVALVNLMTISAELKRIVINWTNLETSIGAIARTKSFQESTASEELGEGTDVPPTAWPRTGDVRLDSISASYKADEMASLAFQDVSIMIKGGEKVAICGRSGSGKSSLVLALARMLDLTDGSIYIDGVNVRNLPRNTVRSALNIVPQDSYFFYEKVSQNLDPSGLASDQDMRSALEKVELLDLIETNGGLHARFNAELLSQGQKQLFSLARAMLKPSRIIVLDEATSSVDKHTASIMQHIIREEFAVQTIIAIAHQLDTIMDFDRVVVLDSGRVVETGSPQELLKRDSIFKRLCQLQGI
ncbi:hypothetical protein PFICI_02668 [Pestalotiopsis fici W106-1]|uniref:P-loop containing nucleoside triphosphate hydrolase protein n=1 Tax=Pestalotiopsis fici (strain W106-1 / CGMCC3.15140) TaxID=1229662 RepID=W3XEW7_PESFW|nr:uncharacterized protein PFICI_02668 [Pestalotiopsis fici W106-1]ETS84643.1 hypothetical protein PFICI_02668 [Pestalotiopsis fici W106-1]